MGGWFSSLSLPKEQIIYDCCVNGNVYQLEQVIYDNRLSKIDILNIIKRVNKLTPDSISPLAFSSLNANYKIVLSLINFDKSCLNIKRDDYPPMVLERMHSGATSAHYACESIMKGMSELEAMKIVELLMDNNIDITVRNKRGYTALDIARLAKSVRVTRAIEDRISLFAGWVYVEQSTGIQKGIGKIFGSALKDKIKGLVGGEWKKNWVVIIKIQGSKSAASPPSMKCPRCESILATPTDVVNKIIASKQTIQPAVRCTNCQQPLRVPSSIANEIYELALYEGSNNATPIRTYSLKGAVANPSINKNSSNTPPGVTCFANGMAFSQKSEGSNYYSRRNIQFGFESRTSRDSFVAAFGSEPKKVTEYFSEVGATYAQATPVIPSLSQEKNNAYYGPASATTATSEWECPTCTLINHAPNSSTRVQCEACGSICIPLTTSIPPQVAPRPAQSSASSSASSSTPTARVVAPPTATVLVEAQFIDESGNISVSDYPTATAVESAISPQYADLTNPGRKSINMDDEIEAFRCPITSEIMNDPVLTCDGFTYERKAISEWFGKNIGNPTSPMTGERLDNTTLVPNHSLRNAIDQYRKQIGISANSSSTSSSSSSTTTTTTTTISLS